MGLIVQIIFCLIFFNAFVHSNASLTSASVIEQTCPDLSSIVLDRSANPLFVGNPTTYFYLPMVSSFTYRNYAEILLGRSAENQTELDAMKFHGYLVTGLAGNTGYSTKFFHQAFQPTNPLAPPPTNLYQAYGVPFGPSSPGSDTSRIATSVDSLVWSDNINAVLITRCVNGSAYDWSVWSPYPTLSSSVINQVLAKVDQLGFDSTKAQYQVY